MMVKKCRLWKSKYEDNQAEEKLKEVDQKYSNLAGVDCALLSPMYNELNKV